MLSDQLNFKGQFVWKQNNWYILIKKLCAYGEIVKRLANPGFN